MMKNLKHVFAIAIVCVFAAGVGFAANTITKNTGEYAVSFSLEKATPAMGKNNVEVVVKDKSGSFVKDLAVVVEYSMPAMTGMPAMNYKATAQQKPDKYTAVIEPSMSGSWNIAVKITKGSKTDTAKFTIDVK
jgi:hypothetical protein